MPIDVNMILDAGQTVSVDGNTDAIEVDGSGLCWACVQMAAMSGASTTCDIRVQVSTDEGANFFMRGKFQQLGPTNDDSFMRIPVYLPKPDTYGEKIQVRLNYDVAGSSPVYVVTKAWLEPILSLAPPNGEDFGPLANATQRGVAIELAAV